MDKYRVYVGAYGTKSWYLNGYRHRKDEPAIEYLDGYKVWYLDGKRTKFEYPEHEYTTYGNADE